MADERILEIGRPANGVAVLTLNRPEQRNALSAALRQHIENALAELERDDQIAAVVLTGSGAHFCAGFDLKELQQGDAAGIFAQARGYHQRVYTFGKPLLAAVNGPALAGGMDLACMCDIRFATGRAEFGQPQVRMGIPAAFDLLRAVLDESTARWLCLTGNRLTAMDAHARGFVARLFDDAEAMLRAAIECAAELAAGGGRRAMKNRIVSAQPRLFES
jgi:enoyl-CoA hydratase